MFTLGPIAFLTPLILTALIVLPILWWLLRAVPPAPIRKAFPGVRLLLGLEDPERTPDRTPWWLLLLRMLALAAAILAFANPILNPQLQSKGTGPLLVLMDGGWASAPDWEDRITRVEELLDQASRGGRPTAVISLAEPVPPENQIPFRDAGEWKTRLQGFEPQAWAPDRAGFAEWLNGIDTDGFETAWLTDGLESPEDATFLSALQAQGGLTVIRSDAPVVALTAPRFEDGAIRVDALRPDLSPLPSLSVSAIGPDPQGIERKLGEARAIFEPGAREAEVEFDLPIELRNRITRIALPQVRSAGAVAITDDGLQRRKVGLLAGVRAREGTQLMGALHYLRTALEPTADLIEASIDDMLNAAPDVVIFADIGTLSNAERDRLEEWVGNGGLLIRFAGPRLAQSGEGQLDEDPLLPVRLRAGGRTVGGAMSWGDPKTLRPFPENSPFFGLEIPDEVDVSSQVMAQPDPNLADRVMAALEDGTPLVTGRNLGDGRVVLFHVTANAEWSSLPLSGLFVQMLERLAVSTRSALPEATELAGQTWTPVAVLDGYGVLQEPGLLAGVDGADLVSNRPGPELPPGLYEAGERRIALNLFRAGDSIAPLAALPFGVLEETMGVIRETSLKPLLLMLALGFLVFDILATLFVAGRLTGQRASHAALMVLAMIFVQAGNADAQQSTPSQDDLAIYATNETVLAYVKTGDTRVDQTSEAGLTGLTLILNRRTAIEPDAPVAVDLESDELAFFPFLYWPISEQQQIPSDAAYAKLNEYLRSGGMILFDTRDANLGNIGSGTPNGRMLQRIAEKLDIPPLERAPLDHVLTRTFYLLQDFPGRYTSTELWVEASPVIEEVEGMPFRNLNDGVTPVVIGGNDWAAAWAVDARGEPMFQVGRGTAGQRQREFAYRFGVNLVMHVMTGNYKSDQVHVPALLERLGQ